MYFSVNSLSKSCIKLRMKSDFVELCKSLKTTIVFLTNSKKRDLFSITPTCLCQQMVQLKLVIHPYQIQYNHVQCDL